MTISRRRLLTTGAAAAAGFALGRLAPVPRPRLPRPPGRSSRPGSRWRSTRRRTGSATPSSASGRTGGRSASPDRATGTRVRCTRKAASDYNYQCAHYGHPSKAGFKDVIHQWKAESWDPEHLIGLYKAAGAKYFMCLANHHDNFDNYASTYQSWNSVALGPKKDLVGGWEKAARAAGLRFAVSVHAAHAWAWYETSQGADKNGPLAGVPYDGHLTKADGKGQWWEGLDPQELYAQNHSADGPGMGLEQQRARATCPARPTSRSSTSAPWS